MKTKQLIIPFLFLFTLCSINLPLFSQERFRRSPPNPDPLPELNLPQVETATLSNGLALSVIYREDLAVITLRLIISAGESYSPSNLPGTAALTAKMLTIRSLRRSPDEIEEMIESIGGELSTAVYPDYSMFTFTFLEEFLDDALKILSELIIHPYFVGSDIENEKRSMYYDQVRRTTDPEYVARRLLFQTLFNDHPYRKSYFSRDVIKNIKRGDLSTFYGQHYRPNNSRIILTGNISLSMASRKVSSYFKTWRSREWETPSIPAPIPNEKLKVCFVDIPKERDVTIYLGNIFTPLSSEDFFPLFVLNQVLGGTATSRLFMNLRESKGYAYFAFSNMELLKSCGVFLISAKVRPEVIHTTVTEILSELEKITKERIPSSEIEQAKSYLIGNFPLNIETFENLSFKLAQIQILQLGGEHWDEYYQNMMDINSNRVFETVQKYPILTPVVVIVGDKNALFDYLLEFKEVGVYDDKGLLQYTIRREILDETR